MINFKTILDALESIFNDNLTGYTVTRNEPRNNDPDLAAKNKGWIGIYRGTMNYESHSIGSIPWQVTVEPKIEIQCASARSGKDAEARLQDAESEVLTLLNANKKLNGTVEMTNGYVVDYEYNTDIEDMYHLAAIITIQAEKRT